jgi:hypothetical protein
MKALVKLWDKEKKVFTEKWLSKTEFENLSFRYCLPYEIEEEDLKKIEKEGLIK